MLGDVLDPDLCAGNVLLQIMEGENKVLTITNSLSFSPFFYHTSSLSHMHTGQKGQIPYHYGKESVFGNATFPYNNYLIKLWKFDLSIH